MPKSRKKKNEHKDFQKVKLKVGRKLQKADNVTNASFHTRTIQVTQKIKTASSTEPSSKRKLNVGELLNQFQHYSTTTRVDAVMGLKDLLSSHTSVIEPNLTTILERSAQLFVDKDPVVRQSVIKLLKVVFSSLSDKYMAPFFRVMSAHLCCAMTHIYEDIQSDSLQVLDLLLDFFPKMVASNCSQILVNFIEQISRSKIIVNANTGKATQAVSSTSNLKTASHKWRAKVLARLHKLLTAILDSEADGRTAEDEKSSVPCLKWRNDEVNRVCPYPGSIMLSWKRPGFQIRSNVTPTHKARSISLSDEAGLQGFAELIFPLLIECWVEADSVNVLHEKGTKSLVVAESLPLRNSVVNVLQLLCQFIKNRYPMAFVAKNGWLTKLCLSDLRTHLMRSFPYSVHIPAKTKSNDNKHGLEEAVKNLNITICDIMTQFCAGNDRHEKGEVILTQYMEDVINGEVQDRNQMKCITDITGRLVTNENGGDVDSLVGALLQRYTRSHQLSTDKRVLFQFFSGIILDRAHQKKIGADIIDNFMTSLPDLYLKVACSNHQMAAQILDVMKTSACQNCWILLQQLNKFISRVAENSESNLLKQESSMQRKLLELIFYLPQIQKSSLKLLVSVLRKPKVAIETCQYFLQILHHKFSTMKKTPENVANYISLMLSAVLGEDNSKVNQANEDSPHTSFIASSCSWDRTIILSEIVGSYVAQFGDTEQIIKLISKFLLSMNFTENQLIAVLVLSNQMGFNTYPITLDLTKRLIQSFKSFCTTVALIQDTPTTQMDSLKVKCDTVLLRMVESVCSLSEGVDVLVGSMQEDLEAHVHMTDLVKLKLVCQSQSLWLRHYDNMMERFSSSHSSCITKLSSAIQESRPELKDLQWWTDFTFLLSRLKL